MQANLEKFKKDLKALSKRGELLLLSMQYDCHPEAVEKAYGKDFADLKKVLPKFGTDYQSWYSESKALIKQLLPDRLADFSRHYEKPKPRKDISYENYRIEDYLQGLRVTRGWEKEKVVGPDAAIPHLEQQLAIVKAVSSRFESSLFDIRQLVQADLFDSEIAASQELLKSGFSRGAGAVAGVVLEKHLGQVAENHNITTRKKNPTISDFNDLLKGAEVLDTPAWRQIQRLGDIRNLCDHSKDREPTKDEVQELISGVEKFTKTLF
ncbi:hypothetical protein [Shewanella sp. SR43-8]|uniref:hypothetical protein n=1 Tax=Shewanella sp. SR43-8 TaxID=2760938 RepID=UPI0015FF43A0|nr:hypothetical protein [Shewanella sp. SR43-8]MBB1323094.1 hypothetical protein [Shewanella sp. SR43-8]